MAIELEQIRDLLLPGLWSVTGRYNFEAAWASILAEEAAPVAVMPTVSLPVAAAMGVAAVIIKNPPVTRRFFGS